MVQITNCYDRAIALLASQFRNSKPDGSKTNFQKMIKALVDAAQEIENVNWELKTERWLDTAIGQQLDELGVILGLPRAFQESDESYRERLQIQIFINTSRGTPEEIIRAAKAITKASFIGYTDVFPAFFQVETNGLSFPSPPNDLVTALKQISPAGVNYTPVTATYNERHPFLLGGDITDTLLIVQPDENDPSVYNSLEIEPYNAVLYVSNGDVVDNFGDGGLDELDFPFPEAGVLSELIQFGGNLPPRS